MINYGIGRYWGPPNGTAVSLYSSIGGELRSGTVEDAQKDLERIQEKAPDLDWKIFVLEELK